MCLMCIEIAKERMTISEARRALPEMIDTSKNDEDRQHFKNLFEASDDNLKKIARENADQLDD